MDQISALTGVLFSIYSSVSVIESIMASLRTTISFWILSLLLPFTSLEARKFVVGGNKISWAAPISTSGGMSEARHFTVGDHLVFVYNPKVITILQVTEEDYESCNKTKPIAIYDAGCTLVALDRSGPFYFINASLKVDSFWLEATKIHGVVHLLQILSISGLRKTDSMLAIFSSLNTIPIDIDSASDKGGVRELQPVQPNQRIQRQQNQG
ncbi:early nodulin-like protein 13 [Alnus glutinosa]|uniref:early nodulin-like protein 13 n=1 Tax=Alnus glutinosa TaxID=3517 RepID=UPI002D79EF2B|nr:early nodulin-like protein 13 [Alnus glutinosa]